MFGRAAADTLGYIAGNIPGAIGADILYQTMANGMRTPSRTPKKRARSQSRGRSAKRGRTTRSVSFARSRSRSRVSRSRSRVSGGRAHSDDYHAPGFHKGKSVVAKRKPIVKLKPAMKNAIKKVMAGSDLQGRFTKKVISFLWFGGVAADGGNYNNKQRMDYLGVPTAFTPNDFLEAARILWKNGAQSPNSTPPNYDSAVDFGLTNFVPTVINSYCKIKMRNNSTRAYHIDLMIIRTKKRAAGLDPRGDLIAQLDRREESKEIGNAGGNVFDETVEKLGLMPTDVDGWRANWQPETITIILQPGQTYEYFVQGPKMQEINYAKILNGDVIEQDQKWTRYFLVRFHTDLISSAGTGGTAGTPGYFAETSALTGGVWDGRGICVDQTYHTHMKMPEQAGFQYVSTTAGTEQALTKRRNAWARVQYTQDPEGALVRIDDEAGGGLENAA